MYAGWHVENTIEKWFQLIPGKPKLVAKYISFVREQASNDIKKFV